MHKIIFTVNESRPVYVTDEVKQSIIDSSEENAPYSTFNDVNGAFCMVTNYTVLGFEEVTKPIQDNPMFKKLDTYNLIFAGFNAPSVSVSESNMWEILTSLSETEISSTLDLVDLNGVNFTLFKESLIGIEQAYEY